MTTISSVRAPDAHVFHRRHNTRPRAPMPSLAGGLRGDAPARPAPAASPGDDIAGHVLPQPRQVRPLLLLADLTSPWAYLAHLRLRRAAEDESCAPVWCAVRDAQQVPLTGLRAEGAARDSRRAELEDVRRAASDDEEIPDDVPGVVPHPRPVSAAFAEGVELGRGAAVLDLLLSAFWLEGRDVGDPEVLRRLLPRVLVDDRAPCSGDPRREWGYVVSPAREPLSDGAYHRLERWQHRWVELGRPGPLTVVDAGGARVRTAAVRALSTRDASCS